MPQDVYANGNCPIDPSDDYTDWDQLLKEYDGQYARHVNTIQSLMQSLVSQLVHGCKQPNCQNSCCATGIRNSTERPVRDYTPRSARILALELLSQPSPDAHLCHHAKPIYSNPTPGTETGPRDPSSLAQRLVDTPCMKRLAEGEDMSHAEPDYPERRRVAAITAKLRTLCELPFDATGTLNPRFVPNNEVADTVASALNLFYNLLPGQSDQTLWQSLAHYINNGHVLPGQTLDSSPSSPSLIELLHVFEFKPYARMCEQVCKVIALRTQVENVAAKFRPFCSDESGNENILAQLADRVTSIARWHTASRKDKWVPWPFPLWFKRTFLQHWDGKPTVARGTITCGALELLEMQQKIWDLSNPEKTSDANLLPYVYNRTDNTEMIRSWMKHDPSVTTTSRHLLSFPFLYSDGQVLMGFRMLNHLRMREAYTASHVDEDLYDRHIASSDAASLEWDSNARQTLHLRDFYLMLTVRRDNILQDAFDQLWQRRKCELLRPLRVRLGQMEGTEVGQDLGGVQIEFFNLACKALFSEDAGMFTTEAITGLSYFRPGSLQPLYMFELFGLLVALALYNGITIPVSFPLAFYKVLLGLPCDDLRDINDGWPEIARSLQSIKEGAYEGLDYAFPLEANGLRLSIDHATLETIRSQTKEYASGKCFTLDLQASEMSRIDTAETVSSSSTNPYLPTDQQWPGWKIHAPTAPKDEESHNTTETSATTTPLTSSNIASYTTDYTHWLHTLSVQPQQIAFLHGFHSLIPPHHLKLFTPQALSHTLEGSSTIDLPALRAATQYKFYTPTEPYINTFWHVLSNWPSSKQKSLLKFVTAAERWPITGVGSLTFRIEEAGNLNEDGNQAEEGMLLPTSSTCFGTLYLPRYRDEGTLERKLGIALEFGGVGFGTA